MSRTSNNQEVDSSISSSSKNFLRNQQKDIVCGDCGGISTAKVQQLLSTLEGTTQLFNTKPTAKSIIQTRKKCINKKKNTARNNNQKHSSGRRSSSSNKKILRSSKQQLGIHKIRSSLSSRNTNNKVKSKSKNNKAKKLSK